MEVAIKTGLLFYAVGLDQSSGDFGAFPHKQRPSILSAGSEGAGMNGLSIKSKREEGGGLHWEEALKMFAGFTDDTVAAF